MLDLNLDTHPPACTCNSIAGFPLPPDGATLGALVCLNLGLISYMADVLYPYLMFLGDEGDERALEALRDCERYLDEIAANGGYIEISVPKRRGGLGAPDILADDFDAAANKDLRKIERNADGSIIYETLKFRVDVIGRFDLKAKFKAQVLVVNTQPSHANCPLMRN